VNFRIPKRLSLFWAAVPLVLLCWNSNAMAATNTATAGTTWAGATWSLGHVPTSSEDAVINSGVNLTIGTAAVCGSLTIGNATGANTTITIGSGGSLVISGTTGNLTINPSVKNNAYKLDVGARTLQVDGTVSMADTNTQTITVSTGTITFSSAVVSTSTHTVISVTSTGTINFNGGFTDGNTVLSEVSGSTINFGDNYTVQTAAVTWTAGADAVFTGTSTITPTAAITFPDLQINSGVTVTLAGNIIVNGVWTNNGGTLSGGSNTVTLTAATGTIGGTGSTSFPGLSIDNGSAYTMNNDNSCTSLIFVASGTASSLTQASGADLTVNGAVTINQPTASVTTAWNINSSNATVSGLITFAGTNTTTARVGKIVITTGTLNANGGITFTASAAATKVIDMSGGAGSLNLRGALTVPGASSTLTAGTSGSIFNYADSVAQTVNFFSAGAYNNLHLNNTSASGATLGAAITAVNVTGNLRVQSGIFSNGGLAIAGSAGDTLQVANGATFKVAGTTSAFPTGFGTITLGATSTVEYSGTLAQTVSAQNYGNLTISAARGANNVTLVSSGTISVAGVLSATATFNVGNGFVTTGSTVSYNGAGPQTITPLTPLLSGGVMYNNLTINNSSGVTLGGNVNVGGTMTFSSGNVTTGSNSVYIALGGSVSRTSGHVVGNFKKFIATGATSKTFEIGDAGNYTPVTVAFASVTVAGDLTAGTTTDDHPNISSSTINSAKTANRYWTLTNSGILFTNYSVTLNFVSGDLDSGANTSNFVVAKYTSGAWSYPTVGTKTSTSTQATGLTSFSDFEVGESAVPDVAIVKSVNPSGSQAPGTDLTYTITFTNSGAAAAQSLVVKDPIPPNTDFKVGSETHDLGTTGLTVVVDYSNDNESSWTYTPVSGGGGAPAGYDRSVTNIRWTFSGNLSQTPPNNNGSVSFITRIR
jgi:fibronectin-binding autotransporter adhesin